MSDSLLRLKAYLLSHDYDQDSLAQIQEWELEMSKAIAAEKLNEHFVIQELVSGFKAKLDYANSQLCENRKLTERERDNLFDRKELYNTVISFFSGSRRRELEQTINDTLDGLQR